MLKYMLDTNIVIYTMKNQPVGIKEIFNRLEGQLCISSVVLMELYFGAEKSDNPEENIRIVDLFTTRLSVLNYGSQAAQHSGQIRVELSKKGTPIGPYDQMIAGHARSTGLIMITNNMREFERVPGLRLENWV